MICKLDFKIFLAIIIFVIIHLQLNGQSNLVVNGGFELNSSCPNGGAQWNLCNGWNNVNLNAGIGFWGTPDYFHTCGTGNVIPPNTFAGVCNPHTGAGMMGLVLYNIPYPNFREYLATPLSCSMVPGTTYTVSFWVTNGTGVISPWTISNIGIHFSNGPLTQSGFGLVNAIPQCEVTTNITSTVWTQYSFTINPTSTWNYLTLGAFRNDASNNVILSFPNLGGPPSSYANYFFDDIQVLGPSLGTGTIGIASSSGNYSICPGQSLTLLGSGANSYTWSNGSNSPSISVSPQVTSNFTLSGASGCAGISQTVATVFVKDAPVMSISGTSSLCSRAGATLTATGADSYLWSNGSQVASITFTPLATTVYTVIGTNAISGCTASLAYQVNVSPSPTLSLTGPTIVCVGTQVNYTASGANTYTWSMGLNGSTVSFTPVATAYYTVSASSLMGCKTSTTFFIVLNECLNNQEINESQDFRVLPNPVDDKLVLLAGKGWNGTYNSITLMDEHGKIVKVFSDSEMEGSPLGLTLNFSEIIKGVYLLTIQTEEKVFTKKIIKN